MSLTIKKDYKLNISNNIIKNNIKNSNYNINIFLNLYQHIINKNILEKNFKHIVDDTNKIKSFDIDWPDDFKIAERIYESIF